jgi:hypothetical protein
MIYFRFLRSHPDVNLAKKGSPELKLANRHYEIQLTANLSRCISNLDFIPNQRKANLIFIPFLLD